MANLIFKDTEKVKDAIMASQKKEIANLYEKWADEIGEKAKYYSRKSTASSVVSERQMKELKKMLTATSQQVSNEVYNKIKNNMYVISDSVVADNVKWLESFGFSKDGLNAAFNYVPDSIVRNLVTGQIYDSGWSLSKAIWSDNEKALKDIYEVIGKGVAQNMSIYEIAKNLEVYVSPSKKKPWNLKAPDGVKIYKKSVDYNAQRLARTLVQHSYQQSFVATTQKNPFITEYIWHSNGSRVCPLCLDRDGAHFSKDSLPMDHPNGMCTMEPVIAENMVDQLADWFNSPDGTYPEIDAFAGNFGYTPSTTAKMSNKVGRGFDGITNEFKTQGYVGLKGEQSDRFMQEYHNEELLNNSRRFNDLKGESSGHMVNAGFNERVRTGTITADDKAMVEKLDKAINSNSLPQDMTLYRGASYKTIPGLETQGKTKEQIVEELQKRVGEVIKPNNYVQVSASSERNYFTNSDISMQIITPKGTHAYISNYEAESEIILGRDVQYEIVGVDTVSGLKDLFSMPVEEKITLIVRVIK